MKEASLKPKCTFVETKGRSYIVDIQNRVSELHCQNLRMSFHGLPQMSLSVQNSAWAYA